MQTFRPVYMTAVNVGGSESGQQSNYNAKGPNDTDNTWSIDGVPSPTWAPPAPRRSTYDFDSFQEMAVTTAAAEAQNPTVRRAVKHGAEERRHTPHGKRAHVTSRTRSSSRSNISAVACGGARQHDWQRQPHGSVLRSRLRSRRAAPKDRRVGLVHHGADQHSKLLTADGDLD